MRPRLHRRYGAAFRRRMAVPVRVTPALLALAFTRGRRVKSNARCTSAGGRRRRCGRRSRPIARGRRCRAAARERTRGSRRQLSSDEADLRRLGGRGDLGRGGGGARERVVETLLDGLRARLSAAVWSAPSKVPWLDMAFTTVRKIIDAPAPPLATPGPFALADIESLKQSFSQAGFKYIITDTFQVTFEFDSPENYTRFHQQNTAPIHAMLASHTEEVKKRAWNSITEAVWQYADSHVRVNLENEVICIVGKN